MKERDFIDEIMGADLEADYGFSELVKDKDEADSMPAGVTEADIADLTSDDFAALCVRYAAGERKTGKIDTGEIIVNALEGLIRSIAQKNFPTYATRHLSDLLQEGRLSVLDNIKKYNPELGRPSTFFYTCILHAMKAYTAQISGQTIHYANCTKLVNKAIDALGANAPVVAIAAYTSLPINTVKETMRQMQARNFVEICTENEGVIASSFVIESPEDSLMAKYTSETIASAIERLGETEKEVICRLFGLGTCEAQSYVQIAKAMGMSVERVRSYQCSALKKLSASPALKALVGISSSPKHQYANTVFPNLRCVTKDFFGDVE